MYSDDTQLTTFELIVIFHKDILSISVCILYIGI